MYTSRTSFITLLPSPHTNPPTHSHTHTHTHTYIGRLNWWTSTGKLPRLEPLATSGDGNCLLHAASLYMWGFHDRQLILRTALHRLLTSSLECERIKRRWRYQTQLRNNEAGGLTFSEEEWDFEWGEIIRIATNQPRRQPTTASLKRYSSIRFSYESLEEIHIFALAHVLKRPIIVIADNAIKDFQGEDLAPIYFGGIYLPLEISATACSLTPVVLAYDASHFSPLVARRDTLNQPKKTSGRFSRLSSRTETVIPLVSPNGSLLPVQFIIDPKKRSVSEKWGNMQYNPGEFPEEIIHLLDHYLKIRWVQLNVANVFSSDEDYDHLFPVQVPKVRFPSAVISQDAQPIYQKELIEKYLENVRERYEEERERRAEMEKERLKRLQEVPVPCEGVGCDMFGKGSTNNLCSRCYQKWQTAKANGDTEQPNEELEGGVNGREIFQSAPQVTGESGLYPLLPGQLPPRQAPPKPLPPYIPPPSYPPPVYPGEMVNQPDVGSEHQEEKSTPSQAAKPTAATPSSIQQARETKTERKPSPSRSAIEQPASDNTAAKGRAKASPSHSSEAGGKDKPWTKKLNIFPSLSPFAKTNSKSGSGYTRDNIQPIRLSEDNGAGLKPVGMATGSQRTKCVNSGCEFFGCPETDGYCSSCFKDVQQYGPIVAV